MMRVWPILPQVAPHPNIIPHGSVPVGMYLIYDAHEEFFLEHLLVFLKSYFQIDESEARSKKISTTPNPQHPHCELGSAKVSLPVLLRVEKPLAREIPMVAFGFYYPDEIFKKDSCDIETFHAYKSHLEKDTDPRLDDARELLEMAEAYYFPTKKHHSILH